MQWGWEGRTPLTWQAALRPHCDEQILVSPSPTSQEVSFGLASGARQGRQIEFLPSWSLRRVCLWGLRTLTFPAPWWGVRREGPGSRPLVCKMDRESRKLDKASRLAKARIYPGPAKSKSVPSVRSGCRFPESCLLGQGTKGSESIDRSPSKMVRQRLPSN